LNCIAALRRENCQRVDLKCIRNADSVIWFIYTDTMYVSTVCISQRPVNPSFMCRTSGMQIGVIIQQSLESIFDSLSEFCLSCGYYSVYKFLRFVLHFYAVSEHATQFEFKEIENDWLRFDCRCHVALKSISARLVSDVGCVPAPWVGNHITQLTKRSRRCICCPRVLILRAR
jgi:hypothetical protein